MLPNGLHFLYHSMGMSGRQGFFFRVGTTNDVIIRPWDTFQESICPACHLSEASQLTLLRDIRRGELNDNLGPYPLSEHHVWTNLCCFIDDQVLLRAQCIPGQCVYASEVTEDLIKLSASLQPPVAKAAAGAEASATATAAATATTTATTKASRTTGVTATTGTSSTEQKQVDEAGAPAMFVDWLAVEVRVREQINTLSDPPQRANQLTALYMDKSLLLETVMVEEYNGLWENLLGELQLSFVLFLLIFCYDSLEQWKRLVDTICRSEAYLLAKPEFAMAFMRTLYEQLNFTPSDFFHDELSKESFLRPALSQLFESLDGAEALGVSSSLVEHRKRLLTFLQKKFGMFEDAHVGRDGYKIRLMDVTNGYLCDDDDAPVVVDLDPSAVQPAAAAANAEPPLTPSQIEVGMFSWRYPYLFDAMSSSPLNEDMVMAAARLLAEEDDEAGTGVGVMVGQQNEVELTVQKARKEARLFLEEEVTRRNASMAT